MSDRPAATPGARRLADLLASPLRNLLAGAVYVLAVMAAASAGYVSQGWSLGDALYMVVVTIYTIGYEEVHPIDTGALRWITTGLIVFGCTGMFFITGVLVQILTLSQVQQVLRGKRVQNQIDALGGHVIICGFGRLGEKLARELQAGLMPFVLIEQRENRLNEARELGYLCVYGNATDERALEAAGIRRARVLATVLPDDAANVFITLSARSMKRDLVIIARGEAPSTESKLIQAGADRVILPTHIGAERIAELILYPKAALLLHGRPEEEEFGRELRRFGLDLEVMAIAEDSAAVGMSVKAIEREAAGAFMVLALNRRDGATEAPPHGEAVVRAGDGLVIVAHSGRAQTIGALFREGTRTRRRR